jgi:hypothetical protein
VLFLAADSLNQGPFTHYQWAFGDGSTSDLFHLTKGYRTYHTYSKKDTTYTVFLLVKTTCMKAFTQTNLFIPDSTPVNETIFYPNPTAGNILHFITERKNELNKIEIVNNLGEPTCNYEIKERTRGYDLNLFSLPTGLYFIRLYFGNETITRKIIKTD